MTDQDVWEAVIQRTSNIDSSGRLEVEYSVFKNGSLEYPQLILYSRADEAKILILEKLLELKTMVTFTNNQLAEGTMIRI